MIMMIDDDENDVTALKQITLKIYKVIIINLIVIMMIFCSINSIALLLSLNINNSATSFSFLAIITKYT